ncbi:MAG: hypothetical protein ACR2MO_12850 [Acidimicrobiales bacterium]
MKLLTAVITPGRLARVTDALEAAGFEHLVVASAQMSPARPGLIHRGVRYADPSVVRVELLVSPGDDRRAACVIREASDADASDDGEVRMWTMDIEEPLMRRDADRRESVVSVTA